MRINEYLARTCIKSEIYTDIISTHFRHVVPNLSKWRIDKARDHATKSGRGQPVPDGNEYIAPEYIVPEKVDHFLDFIQRPN